MSEKQTPISRALIAAAKMPAPQARRILMLICESGMTMEVQQPTPGEIHYSKREKFIKRMKSSCDRVLNYARHETLRKIEKHFRDESALQSGDEVGHPFRGNQWTGGKPVHESVASLLETLEKSENDPSVNRLGAGSRMMDLSSLPISKTAAMELHKRGLAGVQTIKLPDKFGEGMQVIEKGKSMTHIFLRDKGRQELSKFRAFENYKKSIPLMQPTHEPVGFGDFVQTPEGKRGIMRGGDPTLGGGHRVKVLDPLDFEGRKFDYATRSELKKLKHFRENSSISSAESGGETLPSQPSSLAVRLTFDKALLSEELLAALREEQQAALSTAGQQLFDEIGKDSVWRLPSQDAIQFVQDRANLLSNVPDEVHTEIMQSIEQGLQHGESRKELMARISAAFDEIGRSRAETIANTETAAAFNYSRDKAMREAGVTHKKWLHSMSPLIKEPRPTHLEADGQTVPIDDPFDVGGVQFMRPADDSLGAGPEDIINCHCVSIPVEAPLKSSESAGHPFHGNQYESIAQSFETAANKMEKHRSLYREATDKLPDGARIGKYTKTKLGDYVMWLHDNGKKGTPNILEEMGQKEVDKALSKHGIAIPANVIK